MKRVLVSLSLMLASTAALAQDDPRFTAAIVMEPNSKKILFEKNAHQMLPTASMVKMVTLMVAMDKIKDGSVKLETPVTVSARASKMGGSQVYLKQGEQFPLRDLMAATMIHSANDAAMAIAEHIGGTAEAFVRLMNRKAQDLGLKESRFYTPHGLPPEPGQQADVMSPHDLAVVGIELMKYPIMKQYAVIQQAPFRGGQFTMYNPNHLLKIYQGATGIKTGYSGPAGFCVTGSAKRGNMELVTVVMGSKQKRDNFEAAAELLTEAFNNYQIATPLVKGRPVNPPVPIVGGATETVPVVAGGNATLVVESGRNAGVQITTGGMNAKAPIRKGQQVGVIVVKQNGQPVARVPALAAVDVPKEAWWKKFWPF